MKTKGWEESDNKIRGILEEYMYYLGQWSSSAECYSVLRPFSENLRKSGSQFAALK